MIYFRRKQVVFVCVCVCVCVNRCQKKTMYMKRHLLNVYVQKNLWNVCMKDTYKTYIWKRPTCLERAVKQNCIGQERQLLTNCWQSETVDQCWQSVTVDQYRLSTVDNNCWQSRHCCKVLHGVATISRLLKIIGLFCKRALKKRRYSAKETNNFKEPTVKNDNCCRSWQ